VLGPTARKRPVTPWGSSPAQRCGRQWHCQGLAWWVLRRGRVGSLWGLGSSSDHPSTSWRDCAV